MEKQEIFKNLKSNKIENQFKALDFLASSKVHLEEILDDKIISEIINLFLVSEGKPFIGERIVKLGTKFLVPIKKLIKESCNKEVKVLSAMILASHNLDDGIDILLKEIETGGDYHGAVFKFIDTQKRPEIIGLLQKKLRECSKEQIHLVVNYLMELFKRTGSVPKDIVDKFSAADVSWEIKEILKKIENQKFLN